MIGMLKSFGFKALAIVAAVASAAAAFFALKAKNASTNARVARQEADRERGRADLAARVSEAETDAEETANNELRKIRDHVDSGRRNHFE